MRLYRDTTVSIPQNPPDSQSLQCTAVLSGGTAVRAALPEDGRTQWLLQFHPAVHTDLAIRPRFPGAGVRVSLYTAALYVTRFKLTPICELPSVAQTADQTRLFPPYVGLHIAYRSTLQIQKYNTE